MQVYIYLTTLASLHILISLKVPPTLSTAMQLPNAAPIPAPWPPALGSTKSPLSTLVPTATLAPLTMEHPGFNGADVATTVVVPSITTLRDRGCAYFRCTACFQCALNEFSFATCLPIPNCSTCPVLCPSCTTCQANAVGISSCMVACSSSISCPRTYPGCYFNSPSYTACGCQASCGIEICPSSTIFNLSSSSTPTSAVTMAPPIMSPNRKLGYSYTCFGAPAEVVSSLSSICSELETELFPMLCNVNFATMLSAETNGAVNCTKVFVQQPLPTIVAATCIVAVQHATYGILYGATTVLYTYMSIIYTLSLNFV